MGEMALEREKRTEWGQRLKFGAKDKPEAMRTKRWPTTPPVLE